MRFREHFGSSLPRLFGANATTLPGLGIFYTLPREFYFPDTFGHTSQPFIRRHECQHVAQYLRYGFFGFYARYVWSWVKGGFSWKGNAMEQEAVAHEKDTDWPVPEDVLPRNG